MMNNKDKDNINWPICCCGHIAQAHNRIMAHAKRGPHDYGCDDCQCEGYKFPAATPQEVRDALYERREKIINRITSARAES